MHHSPVRPWGDEATPEMRRSSRCHEREAKGENWTRRAQPTWSHWQEARQHAGAIAVGFQTMQKFHPLCGHVRVAEAEGGT